MVIEFMPRWFPVESSLTVWKVGDMLIVDGVSFDFSQLPEGGILPRGSVQSEWFVGDVSRVDGHVVLTLTLPHGDNASEARRFPKPIVMNDDGSVELPQ